MDELTAGLIRIIGHAAQDAAALARHYPDSPGISIIAEYLDGALLWAESMLAPEWKPEDFPGHAYGYTAEMYLSDSAEWRAAYWRAQPPGERERRQRETEEQEARSVDYLRLRERFQDAFSGSEWQTFLRVTMSLPGASDAEIVGRAGEIEIARYLRGE